MHTSITNDQRIRKYLLGQLSKSETSELEEEYFVDNKVFQEIEMTEDDLIDDYLEQELDSVDRSSFEEFFLSTENRKEKLLFARSLKHVVSQDQPIRHEVDPSVRVHSTLLRRIGQGSIAASLILCAALLWVVNDKTQELERLQLENSNQAIHENQLQAELAEVSSAKDQLRNRLTQGQRLLTGLESQVQRLQSQLSALQGGSRLVSMVLQAGALRSEGETPRIDLPDDALILQLELELNLDAEGYNSYQTELSLIGGNSLLVRQGVVSSLSGDRSLVRFSVPSDELKPGDYLIRLAGAAPDGSVEELDQYSFRLTRSR